MFSELTQKLDFTDSFIQDLYTKYKSALILKLNLMEEELDSRWSNFVTDFWNENSKTEFKSIGRFLNNFAIYCMQYQIDMLDEIIDEKANGFNFDSSLAYDEWQKLIEPEVKIQRKLSRQIRLIREPEMSEIDEVGHIMTLKSFVSNVKSGGFIDYDGYGE
jgi:hypothetical protein